MSVYTVGQINTYIARMFAEDYLLGAVTVRGEVSGLKRHTSGHIYFTLKDETGVLSCVMFRQHVTDKALLLRDGASFLVSGRIGVYEKSGRYQLYAVELKEEGRGDLAKRFEELKRKLLESGMFDKSYKKPIPRYIRTLGVVTAPTGAAIRDIINITRRRNPGIQIILYPAIVQGERAAESIARGIEVLSGAGVDCMIVGRGGGSVEDLWAFNEEIVAEAIFNSEVPIISAVGHETDVTIADFVADMRAPTPSAAAELAVFELDRLTQELDDLETSLNELMEGRLYDLREELKGMRRSLVLASPQMKLKERRAGLYRSREALIRRMEGRLQTARRRFADTGSAAVGSAMRGRIFDARKRLDIDIERFEGLSPAARLKSGYAHVADKEGKTVRGVSGIKKGDALFLTLKDGAVEARAERVIYGGEKKD